MRRRAAASSRARPSSSRSGARAHRSARSRWPRRQTGPPVRPGRHLALAADLAGRAAIAIDNARLYRDVQENDRRKNEFLAMLAHELRNPAGADPQRRRDPPDARHRRTPNLQWANDVISRQVEHLVRLVDDLLDISRITGGKIQLRKEPIDVAVGRRPRGRDQPAR